VDVVAQRQHGEQNGAGERETEQRSWQDRRSAL
jgi:hypothetical protein